jgi:hypothetical protein
MEEDDSNFNFIFGVSNKKKFNCKSIGYNYLADNFG